MKRALKQIKRSAHQMQRMERLKVRPNEEGTETGVIHSGHAAFVGLKVRPNEEGTETRVPCCLVAGTHPRLKVRPNEEGTETSLPPLRRR